MSIPTLRHEMDARREANDRFNVRTIVAMMVPLVTELSERHDAGEHLFVHPGCIAYDPSGAYVLEELAHTMPDDPRDRACVAPELRKSGAPAADPRASVFSVGAILYELTTNQSVGPGMRRPSEVAKGISETFEVLLSKALVADAHARPADLAALAQALHHCAPMASIPPPAADESHLDHDDGFEVDISLSMLPPPAHAKAPAIPAPGGVPHIEDGPASGPGPFSQRGASHTAQLSELKAGLEADPRPRYIVIKDGMDHGPFTAVELLQQVATGSFREEHFLRDTLSQEERQISDWEQFAPFAEHARLNRQVEGERKALKATVAKEQRSTQNKALIGGGIVLVLVAAFGGWWARTRSTEHVRVGVSVDPAQFIDFEGGLEAGAKGPLPQPGGGKYTGPASGNGDSRPSSGAPPQVAGGGSCEGARAAYVEDYTKRGVPPDLGAGAFGSLNNGGYLNSCGVPPSMSVSICAAVQNGRAVGVTVRTNPANGGIAGCVRSAVFGLSFPAHPRMDIATTHFKAE